MRTIPIEHVATMERCNTWLCTISHRVYSELGRMLRMLLEAEIPAPVVMDWIEDHEGERDFLLCLSGSTDPD